MVYSTHRVRFATAAHYATPGAGSGGRCSHHRGRFWFTGDLGLSIEALLACSAWSSGRGYPVGKHEDRPKDEQEKKQQSNGQVPPGTRISPKDPQGKHSAPDPDEEET
jgi:hypothetical protein